ncbi:MAG: DUF177 domain-containing protein [Oscillospiraceae bacterium]|nr:DUF177 domain-containing protein [Oscillospiraceae bacterium]
MFIELEPVFNNEGESVNFDYGFDIPGSLPGAGQRADTVTVRGNASNGNGAVLLDASAEFDHFYKCDCCNENVKKRVSLPVRHCLLQSSADEEHGDIYITVENTRLDLDELVTEDILLNLPSKLLCKEGCKGLCFICGANLNSGSCSCEKAVDPRFEKLKQLLN